MYIYCYGDSNTYGFDPRSYFGDRYSDKYRWTDVLAEKSGWQIDNGGINGECIPKSIIKLPLNTDLLIVMLGSNDLLQGCKLNEVKIRMEKFVCKLGKRKTLLIAPPPFQQGGWVYQNELIDRSRALADIYREIAEKYEVLFADAAVWKVELALDGVHFTENGHISFANGLYDYLIGVV